MQDLDQRVTEAIIAAARAEILPRFRRLAAADVHSKATHEDPDDIVTVADREMEARLSAELEAILPGSRMVAEEAATASPVLLSNLDSEGAVWVLDPLDGTKNFAAGDPSFGVMLALVERRRTAAAWLYFPVADELFFARSGGGAFKNGARIEPRPDLGEETSLRGTIYTRYAADPAALLERAQGLTLLDSPACAAAEYAALALGEKDFVVYHRLLPWDHVPGALLLQEAGGVVRHASGQDYRPDSPSQTTLLARSEAVFRRVALQLFD